MLPAENAEISWSEWWLVVLSEGGLGHLVTCSTNISLFPLAVVNITGSEKQRTRVFTHNSAKRI